MCARARAHRHMSTQTHTDIEREEALSWLKKRIFQGKCSVLLHCTVIVIIIIRRLPRVWVEGFEGVRVCGVGGGARTGRAFPQEHISPSTTIEPVRKPQAATLLSWVTEYFWRLISHTHTCTYSRVWQPAQPAHSRMKLYWSTGRHTHQVSLSLEFDASMHAVTLMVDSSVKNCYPSLQMIFLSVVVTHIIWKIWPCNIYIRKPNITKNYQTDSHHPGLTLVYQIRYNEINEMGTELFNLFIKSTSWFLLTSYHLCLLYWPFSALQTFTEVFLS